jgi:hypothetical protein
MKYYRHTTTLREELELKRRQDRVLSGTHFLLMLVIPVIAFFIAMWLLS